MNYKIFENKNFPYLIVDDWYNKEEEKSVNSVNLENYLKDIDNKLLTSISKVEIKK